MMEIISFQLCLCFFLDWIFEFVQRAIATVLIEPFCIDEFRAWKGGFIITHRKDIGKFDNSKNTSILCGHGSGGGHETTYGLDAFGIQLLSRPLPRHLSMLLNAIRISLLVVHLSGNEY